MRPLARLARERERYRGPGMRKFGLSLLAASIALIPTSVLAQGQRGGPPAGHTWRGGMPGPGFQGGGQFRGGGRFVHPGRNFQHRRLQRGFAINPFWFGSQFHINNWQAYGFANPGVDQRWVRYYDDAYLIDRGGRVVDTRYGLDWDQYGEEWGDDDGIPAYRGSRDYRPDADDYAWAEQQEGRGEGWDYSGYGHERGHRGPPVVMHGPPVMHGPMPGGAYTQVYGGGYGYGAYAYPIIIETTVTTAAQSYSEEVIEEYVEVRQRARRPRRARCACTPVRPAPRRRPPAGERG
jgi:Ni/Co efflux regulator RcnB